jgi:acetyl-CoA acyltransferase
MGDAVIVEAVRTPVALGHPLGASGAILMTRMVHHMRDHGIRYGLQTMCEGGGTANATLVELAA